MHEFGTTSAQLAEVKVAAATHAQHNPQAFLQKPVTVEEVLDSPRDRRAAAPTGLLRRHRRRRGAGRGGSRGGAVAAGRTVKVLGAGEAGKHTDLACGPI